MGDVTNAEIAALEHARAMLIHAADQRHRNFRYFVFLLGIVIAGYVNSSHRWQAIVISIVAAVAAALFWALDRRAIELIKDARGDLITIEPKFGISIHTVDRLSDAVRSITPSGRNRIFTGTTVYAAFFVLTILSAVIGLCLSTLFPR
jgi:hypothetical protein